MIHLIEFLHRDGWFWIGTSLAGLLMLLGAISGTLFPQAFAGAVAIIFCCMHLDFRAMNRYYARKNAARDAHHRLTGEWLPW